MALGLRPRQDMQSRQTWKEGAGNSGQQSTSHSRLPARLQKTRKCLYPLYISIGTEQPVEAHACIALAAAVFSKLKTNLKTLDLSEGCGHCRVVCYDIFPKKKI